MSQLKLELPAVIPEALAGHEQYLDEAYRRYTQKQLGEMYSKGMHRLMVFEATPDLQVQEQLAEKDAQITDLRERLRIQEMKMDILENKYEVEKLKNN